MRQRQHAARQRVVREYAETHYAVVSPPVSVQDHHPIRNTQHWAESMSTSEVHPGMSLARVSTMPNQHWGSTHQRPLVQVNEDGHRRGTSSSSSPPPQSMSPPPSNEEMDRRERWLTLREREAAIKEKEIALREREAALDAPLGHTFGTLTVNKKARAVQGDVISGRIVKTRGVRRRHTFGNTHADDTASLIQGGLQIPHIGEFFCGASETVHEGGESDDEGEDVEM